MKRYPSYRKTNIKWFDDIPVHWSFGHLKYKLQCNDGGVWGSDTPKNNNLVLRSTEITIDGKWRLDNPAFRTLSENEISKALLKAGDLLITKSSGSESHIGKTALVTQEIEELNACYSNFMQRIHPSSDMASKYLYFYLNSYLAREEFNFFSTTTTGLANLNTEIINDLVLPFPPLFEQQTIANFLDRKTSQIDTLISKKQRQIELLIEYRTSLINQAVTKGLDLNVPMKDSGVNWLGRIPYHWDVIKIKYSDIIIMGQSPSSDYYNQDGDGLPFLQGNADFTDLHPVPRVWCVAGKKIANKGDVLLSVRAPIGAVNISDQNYYIGRGLCSIRSNKTKPKILFYIFKSLQDELNSIGTGSTYMAISIDDIKNTYIPYIPTEEQESIVNFLEQITGKITILITKTQSQIQLLKEYKTSIISNSVTGKIDVRNQG